MKNCGLMCFQNIVDNNGTDRSNIRIWIHTLLHTILIPPPPPLLLAFACLSTAHTLQSPCQCLYQHFSPRRPSVPPDSCLWLGVDEKHYFPERTADRLSTSAVGWSLCGKHEIWSLQLWRGSAAASHSVMHCSGHIDTKRGKKSVLLCVCMCVIFFSSFFFLLPVAKCNKCAGLLKNYFKNDQ